MLWLEIPSMFSLIGYPLIKAEPHTRAVNNLVIQKMSQRYSGKGDQFPGKEGSEVKRREFINTYIIDHQMHYCFWN